MKYDAIIHRNEVFGVITTNTLTPWMLQEQPYWNCGRLRAAHVKSQTLHGMTIQLKPN
jgi:hypothetical protein